MDHQELKWCDKEPGQRARFLISPSNDASTEHCLYILTALSSNSSCGGYGHGMELMWKEWKKFTWSCSWNSIFQAVWDYVANKIT